MTSFRKEPSIYRWEFVIDKGSDCPRHVWQLSDETLHPRPILNAYCFFSERLVYLGLNSQTPRVLQDISMRVTILLPCAALIWAVYSAIPGFTKSGGKTRLLGSSFGVPGVNATFDYVVGGFH